MSPENEWVALPNGNYKVEDSDGEIHHIKVWHSRGNPITDHTQSRGRSLKWRVEDGAVVFKLREWDVFCLNWRIADYNRFDQKDIPPIKAKLTPEEMEFLAATRATEFTSEKLANELTAMQGRMNKLRHEPLPERIL